MLYSLLLKQEIMFLINKILNAQLIRQLMQFIVARSLLNQSQKINSSIYFHTQ